MRPKFLLPETVARQDGMGAEVALEESGRLLQLTLGITRIIAQENLDISLWGSADRKEWRPLITFPQKFYCGTYSLLLDLTRHPDVSHVRVQWTMGRWRRGESAPLFGFYLIAEEARLHRFAGAA